LRRGPTVEILFSSPIKMIFRLNIPDKSISFIDVSNLPDSGNRGLASEDNNEGNIS
jgi:hypothetical protein